MAKLFGKEFHELSNSWFFRSSVINFEKGEIGFSKFLDEAGNVIFKFQPIEAKRELFPFKIDLVYNKKKHQIIEHRCSECEDDECSHFVTVINYAYKYLSADLIDETIVQTYQGKSLEYNEYWQRVVLNARIEIEDIFNRQTDKIRLFFKTYHPIDIRLIAIAMADKGYKENDLPRVPIAEKQAKALSDAEIELLKTLQQLKCSFSRRNLFFSIYKTDFIHILPILKNLNNKVFIKETGDKLNFSEEDYRINLIVHKIDEEKYSLNLAFKENISIAYVGKTTYVFKKNEIFTINLPFTKEITTDIFDSGFILKKEDLVYFYSVVARQLGLMKCYLDFEENIEIPEIYNNSPLIIFQLSKTEDKIIMKGELCYEEEVFIPMSVIRFPTELIRYDQDDEICWFYIPPQTKYQILNFFEKLPFAETYLLDKKSELVFEGEDNIETLKKTIFEKADPSWKIELSDDLKKEFVYRVKLNPIIETRKNDSAIDWFEYNINYHFKDLKFTHRELKSFFKSREKFLKLEDGRLLYFENKESFDLVDKLLKKSKKMPSAGYKLSTYNLPYIYQLNSINRGIKIRGDNFLEDMFHNLLNRQMPNRCDVPDKLKPIMRSYQKLGFRWLKMLNYYGLNGILADDMGLGKTIQTISIITAENSDQISLVICPKTLLFNWAEEIKKFNNDLTYQIYEGSKLERKEILENLQVNILLCSYSIIQNDIDDLSKLEFNYVILDEVQHIKNSYTQRTKAIKQLRSKHKLALSGTPIENNLQELWSIFDFLMPGFLPSLKRFKNEFVNNPGKKALERLKLLIAPFILRRKKSEVLIELPDKQEQKVYCKLSPIQEKVYLQVLDKVKKEYLSQDIDLKKNYIHVLAALTKLRQICNHPALIDETMKQEFDFSGKIELIEEIIIDAVENGKKLLIFSQFVRMLQILKKLVIKLKIPFEYMDGSTQKRQNRIDNFNNNNNVRIFLISLKTGGFGLNLTAADTVIITDPWWNPMTETQAVDRVHRIGQTKKVMVYKTITKGSIEEKILNLQKMKWNLFDNIINEGQKSVKKIDPEKLRKLFEY